MVDAIRNDGVLINALTGLGTASDSTLYTQVGAVHRLGQGQLDQLCQVWPLNVACTAYPDAATSKGWEISWPEGVSDKVKTAFDTYRNVVGTRTKDSDLRDQPLSSDREIIRWAGYLANVYRGAAIVLNVDDGRPPHEPIDTANIKTIREIEVLDSFQIFPGQTAIANPLKTTHYHLQVTPDWHPGLVSMFQGRFSGAGGQGYSQSYPIHRSRVIRIPGCPVPPQVMRYNNGWDRSLLEVVWDQFSAWESMTKGVEHLVKDYSLFVYQVAGFGDMMTEGNEAAIRQRITSLQMMASMMGGVVLDKDEETVNFVSRQFSGLNDLIGSYRDMLIGALGIPHTILFGESPSGLGATGESEEKTWAKKVGAYQEGWPLAALNRIYQLIFLAKDGPTGGKPLDGWSVIFNPLLEQTEAEKIANRSSQAQTDNVYLQAGVLVAEEVRQSRFGGATFGFETTLDDDAFKKAQEQGQDQGGEMPMDEGMEEEDIPDEGFEDEGEFADDETPPEEEDMSLDELEGERGDSLRRDGWLGDDLRYDSGDDPDPLGRWLRERSLAQVQPIVEQWQKRTLAWILAQGDMNAALQRITMQPDELFARLPYRGLEKEIYQGMILANLAGREQVLDEGDDGDGVRFDGKAKPSWFHLPFKEAVDYFKAKVAIPVETYQQLTADFHDWAFVVARMAQADLIKSAKWLVEQSITEGMSFAEFEKSWSRLIGRKGWKPANPRHIWTIFDTNFRGAMGAGRYQQMREPSVLTRRPLWVWRWRDSPQPRLHHKALHNKAIYADDPFWRAGRVPAGWGCRCALFSMSEAAAKRKGIEILTDPPDPKTIFEKGFDTPFHAETPYGSRDRQTYLNEAIKKYEPNLQGFLKKLF